MGWECNRGKTFPKRKPDAIASGFLFGLNIIKAD